MKTLTEEQLKKALTIYHQEYIDNPDDFKSVVSAEETAKNQVKYIFDLIKKHSL